jgi:serine protease Do
MNSVFARVMGNCVLAVACAVAIQAQAATTAPTITTVQTPAETTAPRRPGKRIVQTPARVTVIPSQPPAQPQVVTIIHRLSGVKVLRLLLRQAGGGVVETIDPQTITDDAHASIIAGWALEDGKTIVARLPQAAAELEVGEFAGWLPQPGQGATIAPPFPFAGTRMEPDLTVVTGDGRKLRARLIGLDAETGFSVLQLIGVTTPPATAAKAIDEAFKLGQAVDIFAPEPATPEGEASTRVTFVKVGKSEATITNDAKENSGGVDKLTVRGNAKFSTDLLGGVVCNQDGATIGIVDSIDGNEARIATANAVRAAIKRVVERQASVPRPLLGVRGEPIGFGTRSALMANGWHEEEFKDWINQQSGILLTTVVPGTPAAFAKLKPGDVIVSVNDFEVRTPEQFSKLLGDAGSGQRVLLSVRRPGSAKPLAVPVTLGGSFTPLFEGQFQLPRIETQFFGWRKIGIRTMALTPRAATKLGAQHGVIVVGVQPDSPAARAGVREGDVIETIDGHVAAPGVEALQTVTAQKKHTFVVVRGGKEKLTLEVEE